MIYIFSLTFSKVFVPIANCMPSDIPSYFHLFYVGECDAREEKEVG
jgi:hypothetical protein